MMNLRAQGIVIAGTHSSVGKSSITSGLLRLLMRNGWRVKPFKAGPDYIDPSHHRRASGAPSYNLDTFMCSRNYVRALYDDVMQTGDLAVVEGMMGLFDGVSATSEKGSTAEIAKLLNLSVVLVIDGRAMARSAAALVKGFAEMDPDICVAGVIANNVNSSYHYKLIKDAVERYTPVKLLGHLPTASELKISSRHLGLHQGSEQADALYDRWANHIDEHIGLDKFLRALKIKKPRKANPHAVIPPPTRWAKPACAPFTVAVARDEAFQFIYPDTLDYFVHQNGVVKFFSPLRDAHLPADADWLYFPGGYPELYAKDLSANRSMLGAIRRWGKSGKVIVGECGGLMVLGKKIIDEQGRSQSMTGVFDFSTTLHPKKMTLGYRHLRATDPGHQPMERIRLKGHEFHFSTFAHNNETPQWCATTQADKVDGYRVGNAFAFYSHLYWAGNAPWLKFILSLARKQG